MEKETSSSLVKCSEGETRPSDSRMGDTQPKNVTKGNFVKVCQKSFTVLYPGCMKAYFVFPCVFTANKSWFMKT